MTERVLFLNRWPQYRDGRRWDNELARPEDLIDHERYRVTYVCDPPGRSGVPAGASDVHCLADLTDAEAVLALVAELVAEHGGYDHVIALSEYLLDVAARIRAEHGIPGPRPAELDRFRDKTVMKTVLGKAGVRVPRWFHCRSPEQVLSDAGRLGYPLILKPVRGASSQGVRKVASAGELRALCATIDLTGYEIEEFVAGDILHADGVVDRAGECLTLTTSRYVANCLAFAAGEPFGSVIETDPETCAESRRFALRCLAALGLRASAFHLEFFATDRELVFLEIGARVPGADVSYVLRDVRGVNLFRLWADVLLGTPVRPDPPDPAASGGWLMIPRPEPLPQRVVSAASLLGTVPFVYRELVPRAGEVLDEAPGYASLQGGRFLFRGGTQDQVIDAMHRARSTYRLTAVPVT
jgi:biotin carboxylase